MCYRGRPKAKLSAGGRLRFSSGFPTSPIWDFPTGATSRWPPLPEFSTAGRGAERAPSLPPRLYTRRWTRRGTSCSALCDAREGSRDGRGKAGGTMTLEEALRKVWRATMVEHAPAVELEGQTFPVRTTPKKRLREVDFVFDHQELRGLEQFLVIEDKIDFAQAFLRGCAKSILSSITRNCAVWSKTPRPLP